MNVPGDIQPTIQRLLRRLDENITIPVKLKKKLSFERFDYHENVQPTEILIALYWLINNREFDQNSNINVDEDWFQEIIN